MQYTALTLSVCSTLSPGTWTWPQWAATVEEDEEKQILPINVSETLFLLSWGDLFKLISNMGPLCQREGCSFGTMCILTWFYEDPGAVAMPSLTWHRGEHHTPCTLCLQGSFVDRALLSEEFANQGSCMYFKLPAEGLSGMWCCLARSKP